MSNSVAEVNANKGDDNDDSKATKIHHDKEQASECIIFLIFIRLKRFHTICSVDVCCNRKYDIGAPAQMKILIKL